MKKLYFAAAAVVSMLIFTGCPGNGPAPVEPNSGLISEIAGDGERITFTYDDRNRLTRVTYSDGEYTGYAYPDAMTIIESSGNGSSTYTLNASRYLETLSVQGGTDSYSIDFTYQDHYLESYVVVLDEDDQETSTFTWENGNLKSVQETQGVNYTFKYGTTANKASIDLNYFFVMGDMPSIRGILGKPSANLATEIAYSDGENSDVVKFRYDTDAEGYVRWIFVTDGDHPEVGYTVKYKISLSE